MKQSLHVMWAVVCLFCCLASAQARDSQFAGRNGKYTVGWNGDLISNETKHVIGHLPFFGGYSIRNEVVFSKDGALLAYSQGGGSIGSAIVIVRLSPKGTATPVVIFSDGAFATDEKLPSGLPHAPPPIDVSRANHVYEQPLSFSEGKFFYSLSADKKEFYFSYDLKNKAHVRLKFAPTKR